MDTIIGPSRYKGSIDPLQLHLENLSVYVKHAFSVALLLGKEVEPVMWMYCGQRGGKYVFKHKVNGSVVLA